MEIEIYSDVVCPWCYIGKRGSRPRSPRSTASDRPLARVPARSGRPQECSRCCPGWPPGSAGGPGPADCGPRTPLAAAEGMQLDYDRALIANTFTAHRLPGLPTAGDVCSGPVRNPADWSRPCTGRTSPRAATSAPSTTSSAWPVGPGSMASGTERFLDSDAGVAEVTAEIAQAHASASPACRRSCSPGSTRSPAPRTRRPCWRRSARCATREATVARWPAADGPGRHRRQPVRRPAIPTSALAGCR